MSDKDRLPTNREEAGFQEIRREISERLRHETERRSNIETLLVSTQLAQFESRIVGIHNTHNNNYRTLDTRVSAISTEMTDLVGSKGHGRVGALEEKFEKLEKVVEQNRAALVKVALIIAASSGTTAALMKLFS